MIKLKDILKEAKPPKWNSEMEKDFKEWVKGDDVIKNRDGSYSTQDAQWRNKLTDLDALRQYFFKEFV